MSGLTKEDFENKVVSMKDYVYNLALFLAKDPEQAKEIRQKTLLRALEQWSKYTDKNFKGWISTLTKNIFYSDIEEQKKRQTIRFDPEEDMGDYSDQIISYIGNPQDDLEEKETRKIISTLPKTNRLPIQMTEEGFTQEEIGKKLALNKGAVKGRVFKGKIILKTRLEDKPVYSVFLSFCIYLIDSFLFSCLFLIAFLFGDI